jgi:putative flippase GtrA
VIDTVLSLLPRPLRDLLHRHNELLKFAIVGGTTFIVDTVLFLALKHSVLESKPVISKIIATLIATIVSYILNREWSFKSRGGRQRHHEALLFFVISGIGIAVTAAPLYFSRYALDLRVETGGGGVSPFTQEIADFVSAQIVGTLLAMAFRWWAFRRFVFPHADVQVRASEEEIDFTAAELLGDVWPLVEQPDGRVEPEKLRDIDDTEDPLATRK